MRRVSRSPHALPRSRFLKRVRAFRRVRRFGVVPHISRATFGIPIERRLAPEIAIRP